MEDDNLVDEILGIYNYPFFNDKKMVSFVKSVFNKPRNMVITTPDKSKFTSEDICKSFFSRIPVYFGKPMTTLFNDTISNYQQPFGIKYAVCGKAYLMDNSYFYAIHTWGINLESNETDDYKNVVKDEKINKTKYRNVTKKMIECIVKAKNHYKLDKVYMPLIGLGAYLTAVSYDQVHVATTIFFEEISKTDLTVIILNKNSISAELYDKYKDNIEIGNLFTPRKGKYGVVNAWDSHSYIGNGGSRDNTIDGWFVAGYGPNKDLKNSSFLHNYYFNRDICDNII